MRTIIFNDKDNFEGSLIALQNKLDKKFNWDYEKLQKIIFNKLKEKSHWNNDELKLIRAYLYTGEYNSDILKTQKWRSKNKIHYLNRLIKKEESLLQKLSVETLPEDIKKVLIEHIIQMKGNFEKEKDFYEENIKKQKNNFAGQRKFFETIYRIPFIECKTTPLKQKEGVVYQKGVDAKIAIDMVSLAHSNSYDIALLLSGDSDLIEAVKLVKDYLGKIVILVAYYDDSMDGRKTASKDMIEAADLFINLRDFEDGDLGDLGERIDMEKLDGEIGDGLGKVGLEIGDGLEV